MGDRNIDFGTGTLFIGETKLIGNTTTLEFTYDDKEFVNDQVYLKIPLSQEATLTAEVNFTSVLRKFCPNNWLKMHGYPMRRRRFKK
jgi:hypothetical protein